MSRSSPRRLADFADDDRRATGELFRTPLQWGNCPAIRQASAALHLISPGGPVFRNVRRCQLQGGGSAARYWRRAPTLGALCASAVLPRYLLVLRLQQDRDQKSGKDRRIFAVPGQGDQPA